MTHTTTTRQPRTVTFTDTTTQQALQLSLYGQTDRAVARQTNLTTGQIQYRRRLAGVSPTDWRNGTLSTTTQMIRRMDQELGRLAKIVDRMVQQERRHQLKPRSYNKGR